MCVYDSRQASVTGRGGCIVCRHVVIDSGVCMTVDMFSVTGKGNMNSM